MHQYGLKPVSVKIFKIILGKGENKKIHHFDKEKILAGVYLKISH